MMKVEIKGRLRGSAVGVTLARCFLNVTGATSSGITELLAPMEAPLMESIAVFRIEKEEVRTIEEKGF